MWTTVAEKAAQGDQWIRMKVDHGAEIGRGHISRIPGARLLAHRTRVHEGLPSAAQRPAARSERRAPYQVRVV